MAIEDEVTELARACQRKRDDPFGQQSGGA